MAGNGLTFRSKVKASTILEVVVAMVMIILVFGIAMMIYTNTLRSSLSVKKIKAHAILQETLLKAAQENENTSRSFTIDDFKIDQDIKPYNNDTRLTDIRLSAYDGNGQEIATLEKVIINSNE